MSGSKPVSKDVFFLVFGFRDFFRRFSAGSKQTGGSHMIQCKRTSFGTILISHWFSHGFSAVHHIVLKISMAGPLLRLEHVGLGYIYIYLILHLHFIYVYIHIYIYCMCINIYVHMLHLYIYIITFISNNDRYGVRWQEATPSIWIISSNRFSAKNSK